MYMHVIKLQQESSPLGDLTDLKLGEFALVRVELHPTCQPSFFAIIRIYSLATTDRVTTKLSYYNEKRGVKGKKRLIAIR